VRRCGHNHLTLTEVGWLDRVVALDTSEATVADGAALVAIAAAAINDADTSAAT
jgi:hypothetical protein